MRITSSILLVDGVYNVVVDLASGGFTPEESAAVYRWGFPVVACGGDIPYDNTVFTLPDDDRRFPSQFPAKQRFSSEDWPDAAGMASAWRDEIKTRLDAAITELRNKTVGLTGEETVIINTDD